MRRQGRVRASHDGRSHRWGWILAAGVLVLLGGMAAGYYGPEWLRAGGVPVGEGCQREVARLRRQRGELLALQARLDEALRLERESTRALRKTLAGQAAKVADLEKELAFYGHLARLASAANGQLIQDLWIVPEGAERRYRFRVALVRPDDARRNIRGTLTLSVAGQRDGKRVLLSGTKLDRGAPHSVDFRYFQVVEGSFALPEGLEPESVSVSFKPKKGKGRAAARRFPWAAARSRDRSVRASRAAFEGE